jgi:hypothetical protein
MADQKKITPRRGISKCPEPLAELLDHINLLPRSDAELAVFSEYLVDLILQAEDHIRRRPKNIESTVEWYKRQIDLLKDPDKALCKALHEPYFTGKKFFSGQDVVEEFDGWIRDREMLTRIIEAFGNYQELEAYSTGKWKPGQSAGLLFRLPEAITATDTVSFGFNADSTLKPHGFRVLEILMEYRVEVRRLGICPECKKYYYAKKVIHQTCGTPKCAEKHSRKKEKE